MEIAYKCLMIVVALVKLYEFYVTEDYYSYSVALGVAGLAVLG